MTGALEDYDTARHAAIAAVLEMLTAERQLASPDSDVLAVTDDDCEVDAAAGRLAEAAGALPFELRPAGWGEPPAAAGDLGTARRQFVRAVLLFLAAGCAEGNPRAAESGAAEAWLAITARNLAADAGLARSARANERGRLV